MNLTNTTNDVYTSSLRLRQLNIGVALLCLLILAFNIVTLTVVRKSTSIPYQIRSISILFLLSQCASQATLIVHSAIALSTSGDGHAFRISRKLFTTLFNNISTSSVMTLAVERAIALSFPLRYFALATKRRTNIGVICIALFCTVLCMCPMMYGLLYSCVYHRAPCEIAVVTKPERTVFLYVYAAHDVLILSSYIIIMCIVRRHRRQIRCLEPGTRKTQVGNYVGLIKYQLNSTSVVTFIIISHLLLHIPYFVHAVLYDQIMHLRWGNILYFFTFICLQTNTVLNAGLYVWKFQECRMKFVSRFLSCIPYYKRKAERMRLVVYNIVTYDSTSKRHGIPDGRQ